MTIARAIQQALLPKHLPTTGWLRVAAASVPSRQVGGDYFDLIQISPEVRAIIVADVSGKGVSSALLAGLLQGAFLRAAGSAEQISEMLDRMNRFLLSGPAVRSTPPCSTPSSAPMGCCGRPTPHTARLLSCAPMGPPNFFPRPECRSVCWKPPPMK